MDIQKEWKTQNGQEMQNEREEQNGREEQDEREERNEREEQYERERRIRAVGLIAWGFLLLQLNFSIGTLNLLPNWLGYLLVLSALPLLAEETPAILLLRPLGIVLAVWEGLQWLLVLFHVSLSFYLPEMAVGILALHFHFQLFTDLAEAAKIWECPQVQSLLRLRTVRTIFMTVLLLPFSWEKYEYGTVLFVAANVVVAVWICAVLFSMRSSLREV